MVIAAHMVILKPVLTIRICPLYFICWLCLLKPKHLLFKIQC